MLPTHQRVVYDDRTYSDFTQTNDLQMTRGVWHVNTVLLLPRGPATSNNVWKIDAQYHFIGLNVICTHVTTVLTVWTLLAPILFTKFGVIVTFPTVERLGSLPVLTGCLDSLLLYVRGTKKSWLGAERAGVRCLTFSYRYQANHARDEYSFVYCDDSAHAIQT